MQKMKISYTVLAKTIPELSRRDGNVYTCSIGWCPEFGLIRVYPLPLTGMKKWGTYQIEVERNKRDSRPESWKLSSYTRHENFIGLEKDVVYKGQANKGPLITMLFNNTYPAISKLNEDRKSIGVVCSKHINTYWDVNERYINTNQIGMFEDVEIAEFTKYMKETKEKEARIRFIDGDGVHDLQLNEWQYYEYQRKFKADKDAFRYIQHEKSNLLLLGNMFQYRNTWICLSVFSLPSIQQSIDFKDKSMIAE